MLTRIKNYVFNLGAISITLGVSAISAYPSLAQTTSVPITGGVFSVNVTSLGAVTSNPNGITVLTPVGTATVTNLTGTTATSTSLTSTNGTLDIQGVSDGTVNFDTGSKASFTAADTTIKGEINGVSVMGAPVITPVDVSALTGDATVTGAISKGSSITIPNSSITSAPTDTVVVPITGGSFDVIRFTDGTVSNIKTTVLTPFGTANFTKFAYASLDNLNGASIFAADDEIRGVGKVSGSVAVSENEISTFTDSDIAVLGTVKTANDLASASVNLKGDVTGGNFVVPSSSITTLPTTSNFGSIILVVANPKLLKLVKDEPKFVSLKKFKYLTVLSLNDELFTYTSSKSTKIADLDVVTIGERNATDSVVFLSFKKISFFPVSHEVALTRPIFVIGKKIPPGQLKKQRVVFVGMGSRLVPGFGLVTKTESFDSDD